MRLSSAFAAFRRLASPWPKHPIDRLYGIETSSHVPRMLLRTGNQTNDVANVGYAGSQPSIIRRSLNELPAVEGAAFFDLGCGKGRVLATATEFPFASITGIELAPRMCAMAQRNCAKLAARHPERTRAQAICGNAVEPDLPESGQVVLFLYNSFRGPLVEMLVRNLETTLAGRPELKLFLIYYNPTQAAIVDGSETFERYFAERLTFTDEERGSSPFGNDHDSVVIWQSRSTVMAPPRPGHDRPVRIDLPDLAAQVEA